MAKPIRPSRRRANAAKGFGGRKDRVSVPVFTVGYAGRDVRDLVATLASAGIRRLVDVRALPLSRRRGFSKTSLAATLEAAGIEYVHIREAGNPFRHEAADIDRCLSLYGRYLESKPEIVERVSEVVAEVRSALLCVESEAESCHRSVLAGFLRRRDTQVSVTDL